MNSIVSSSDPSQEVVSGVNCDGAVRFCPCVADTLDFLVGLPEGTSGKSTKLGMIGPVGALGIMNTSVTTEAGGTGGVG